MGEERSLWLAQQAAATPDFAPDGRRILYGTLVGFSHRWHVAPGDTTLEVKTHGVIRVRCPFCREHRHRDHFHSWRLADGPGVISHRISHCHDRRSPLFGRGYYIAIDPGGCHQIQPGYVPRRRRPVRRLVRQ